MMKSWQLCHSDEALMSKNTQKRHISFFKKATYHAVLLFGNANESKGYRHVCLDSYGIFQMLAMNGKLRKKCTIIQRDIKDYNHGT